MVEDRNRKRLPPYVSYRTFRSFIDGLQQRMPARIDRSYWGDNLSGSNGIQLMGALRFMGLVTADGAPTARLRQLIQAKGAQKAEILKQIASESFAFLLQGPFETQTASYGQLAEVFQKSFNLTEGVTQKCVRFFVAMASESGLPLSPFITKKVRPARSGTGTKPLPKRRGTKIERNIVVPQDLEEVPGKMPWDKLLLGKFPAFDPTWPNEVKLGWFEAFSSLKFPTFDPSWGDEVKLKWFTAFDELLKRYPSLRSSVQN